MIGTLNVGRKIPKSRLLKFNSRAGIVLPTPAAIAFGNMIAEFNPDLKCRRPRASSRRRPRFAQEWSSVLRTVRAGMRWRAVETWRRFAARSSAYPPNARRWWQKSTVGSYGAPRDYRARQLAPCRGVQQRATPRGLTYPTRLSKQELNDDHYHSRPGTCHRGGTCGYRRQTRSTIPSPWQEFSTDGTKMLIRVRRRWSPPRG